MRRRARRPTSSAIIARAANFCSVKIRVVGPHAPEKSRDYISGRVFGLVHDSPPAAQLFDDAVVRNGLADHECSGEMSAVMVGRALNLCQ